MLAQSMHIYIYLIFFIWFASIFYIFLKKNRQNENRLWLRATNLFNYNLIKKKRYLIYNIFSFSLSFALSLFLCFPLFLIKRKFKNKICIRTHTTNILVYFFSTLNYSNRLCETFLQVNIQIDSNDFPLEHFLVDSWKIK
jgi:hypothetical protein